MVVSNEVVEEKETGVGNVIGKRTNGQVDSHEFKVNQIQEKQGQVDVA